MGAGVRTDSANSVASRSTAADVPPVPVSLSDDHLTAIARDTAVSLDWERLLRIKELGPTGWKWLETVGDVDVYVRQEQQAQRFAVLAIGVVPCSWRELRGVLHAETTEAHMQSMEALYGAAFTHGAVAHTVPLAASSVGTDVADDPPQRLAHLSVKTATFGRSRWLSSADEWCYVDALHLKADGQAFERHLSSLSPKHVFEGRAEHTTKTIDDLVVAYKVKTEGEAVETPGVKSSRVYFYGEMATSKATLGASWLLQASDKTRKARLMMMAHACDRLLPLVRRRRLGVQVLVDQTRFRPPTNTPCLHCQRFLLVAKQCRLCGRGVCGDCSSKHDRERAVKGSSRLRVESVRICRGCLARVDAADYDNVTRLESATVTRAASGSRSPAAMLTDLLHSALQETSSPKRRESVVTVIKNVLDEISDPRDLSLDQPQAPNALRLSRSDSIVLVDDDALTALKTKLHVPLLNEDDGELSNSEHRQYLLHPGESPTTSMLFAIPENEEERLEAVAASGLGDMRDTKSWTSSATSCARSSTASWP
ncbi:hypothetical protein PINS_up022081 [Pythium insidiosum]|nr:hypothetical protein PINS_up022081 [Pythium insidiosum]